MLALFEATWKRSNPTPLPTFPSDKPTRRSQAERSASTRALLLDATIDSLVEDGYASTTTTGIADRAGVSRGAQMHHFASKDLLYQEVFETAG